MRNRLQLLLTWVPALVLLPLGLIQAQEAARPPTSPVRNIRSIAEADKALETSFAKEVKPFLNRFCLRCHNEEKQKSGVRVDLLDGAMEDRQLRLWGGISKQIHSSVMPPEDELQPTKLEREPVVAWIQHFLAVATSRPSPKNGGNRRLTIAQYRNTLRELLRIEDELTDALPPDAFSRDGFVNNQETLALSPLLLEGFFETAEKALHLAIVDPEAKPVIQNFRVDLGKSINRHPCPDHLVLGADSLLLNNEDLVVTQLTPSKLFAFEPFFMRTKYRFIEGYQGNDTVRGWRDYDSLYHAVFACMRGSRGYPKGNAYSTVPEGLLLRPAIPNDEIFGGDGTYGPKANFKISLRELPAHGHFRVIVTAAKYPDGLLLDPGTPAQRSEGPEAVVCHDPKISQTLALKQAGIYQVDVHIAEPKQENVVPNSSRLSDALAGFWSLDGHAESANQEKDLTGKLLGKAKFVESPFGKAVSVDGDGDGVMIPRHKAMNIGSGNFTVAAWIHPRQLSQGGIVGLGKYGWRHGWYLDMPNDKGVLRIETAGPDNQSNGTVVTPPGAIRTNAWQHVAAVVQRGTGATRLFVNGYVVAKGSIGPADLDNPEADLHIGRIQDAQSFRGALDEVRFYRRALDESEIQALLESGRQFVPPPPREPPPELTLAVGDRQFSGTLRQPAFLVARFPAGTIRIRAEQAGTPPLPLEKIVFTPLAVDQASSMRFEAFEKRSPRLGVHLGLRRDCGSTLSPVGTAQTVSNEHLTRFTFEGAISNFPSPDVEPDNVNYLAGVREIGVRSEYTDGRDMPRLLIRSVEFEGPFFDEWPPASHRGIFVDFDRKEDLPAYAREILRKFATRAYRRPITASEETGLVGVFDKAIQSGANFYESIKEALQVAIASPQFLCLIENSSTPEPERLDSYELASKLSYFLWNGPPDHTLLQRAESSTLWSHLEAEVSRMIEDPRFSKFIDEFAFQWLGLEKFVVLEPDRDRFPKLTRETRNQLRQEPLRFLQYLIRNNLPTRNLIQSDFVVANEVVASYYELGDRPETGLEFVPILHGRRELGGLLSQAAIMAGLSNGRESNPIKRGAWLARRIIAEPPDDPPPNVPALKEDTQELPLRERLEHHRNQRGCAGCHSKIDPWGVPLEEFDAGGRLKLKPVDARSILPDKTHVAGMDGLRRYLAEDRIDQVAYSFLRHLSTYATGRHLSFNETEFLKKEGLQLKANGYRMQEMVRFVVRSPLFLEK